MTRPAVHRRSFLVPALTALSLWGPVACTAGSTAELTGPSEAIATSTPAPSTPAGSASADPSAGAGTAPATASGTELPTTTDSATIPPSTGTSAPPSSAAVSTSTTRRASRVDSVQHTYVDARRNRSILTTVYWPTDADTADRSTVVLIAHGFRLPGWGYDRLARQLAATGRVVAVPDFPHTSGVVGDGNRGDIVNQPADLSFMADTVIGGRLPDGSGAPWPRPSSDAKLAIVGHSDGGLTATAFAYNDRYRDLRVVACASLTGGIALFPGAYFTPRPDGSPQPPLLAAHGTADEINPTSASANLFAAHPGGAASPKHLVRIEGGSHLGPYMFDTASPDLGTVIADFIDRSRRAAAAPLSIAPGTALTIQSG